MKKIWLLLLPFLMLSCATNSDQETVDFTIETFAKEWVNSAEEQNENTSELIYRPKEGNEFPFRLYRQKYIFEPSGDLKYFVLADNDGHYYENGFWSYDEHSQILLLSDSLGNAFDSFQILELNSNFMKLTPIKVIR